MALKASVIDDLPWFGKQDGRRLLEEARRRLAADPVAEPRHLKTLRPNRPDPVWVADITSIRLKKEFVYLAMLMDVFTRSIRGWHLGRSREQERTITALRRALARGRPEIHHAAGG